MMKAWELWYEACMTQGLKNEKSNNFYIYIYKSFEGPGSWGGQRGGAVNATDGQYWRLVPSKTSDKVNLGKGTNPVLLP